MDTRVEKMMPENTFFANIAAAATEVAVDSILSRTVVKMLLLMLTNS